MAAVVPKDQIVEMLARLEQMAKKHGDREVISLKCTFASFNGNWPRIKRTSWFDARNRYEALVAKYPKNATPTKPEPKTAMQVEPVTLPHYLEPIVLPPGKTIWDLLDEETAILNPDGHTN